MTTKLMYCDICEKMTDHTTHKQKDWFKGYTSYLKCDTCGVKTY